MANSRSTLATEQLILNQLSFNPIGPVFDCTKSNVLHSKDENQRREWRTGWP
jgi:hypothetical protein